MPDTIRIPKYRCPNIRTVPDVARVQADALVVFATREGETVRLISECPLDLEPLLRRWLENRRAFKATEGQTIVIPRPSADGAASPAWVALTGTGEWARLEGWRIERAAAAAARALSPFAPRTIAWSATIQFPAERSVDAQRLVHHLVRGAIEGGYRFVAFQSESSNGGSADLVLAGGGLDNALKRRAEQAATEAATLNQVADIANLPGNEATPDRLARMAQKLARSSGLRCRVYDRAALEREKCRAFLAVASGSQREPRLIVLEHRPAAARKRPIILIGKTLTFDAGGISLKPAANMEWMRYDKCGGMAVLAVLLAAARLRLPDPIIGMLATAENMPDGGAMRPGDIVRTRSGKTVEIVNTDAEGRLVLADTLSLAGDLKPQIVIDLATLTGAAKVALGPYAAALCSTDETLGRELQQAGERSGDRVWPLPLWPEYDELLKSSFADLKNVGEGGAGTIQGAAFLKAFAPTGVPWAHIDIAPTAWVEKDQPHRGAGATLFGARLLLEWLRGRVSKTR